MCTTPILRIPAANIGPNRFHQNRTVSWLMSIPRSARKILDVAQRQRVSHVHHHDQTDDLRRAIEIAERVAHGLKLPRRDAAGLLSDSTIARHLLALGWLPSLGRAWMVGRVWGGRPEAGRTRAARFIPPLSSCAKQESLFRRWTNARFASPRLPLSAACPRLRAPTAGAASWQE
jgi:hypothetical protein